MKISCELIKDLLPLYYDDVCSNESRTTVEEHLLECDTCKKYLDSMNSDLIQTNAEKAEEQAKSNILKGIKKKLLRKNVMISAISVICAIAVLLGGFSLIFHYQIPIPYDNGLVSVKMGNTGMLDVSFNGDDYYCSHQWSTTIEKDGKKQQVVYIYYTDTIWTKHFSKPQNDKEYKYSINNSTLFDHGNGDGLIEVKKDISAVYYLAYSDIAQMSLEELLKISSKAVLLWEK
ncbi:zf-HC2 domain-containing protein [Clostridium tagluense]|uniref:zf-HC2 domain-containing protein n=1 Tax=Clostridium tagluense TaxID=360422 RepID=UPI001CF453D7|nr:zf-HC2 domain-containing protein [Clostridium tagluense]MCB2300060.1 zf-HC2 domain-containing protein [Clostridium tagluense]